MTQFGLQPHLDILLAQRPFPSSTDPASRRNELGRLLGLENREPVPVTAVKLRATDCGSYTEEAYSLDVGEGVQAPLYVLVPQSPPPYTPILAFHGHDPGVQYILGHYPDAATAVTNRSADNNYAQALAEAGYLVCAVEQRGMGERLTAQTGETAVPRSCRHLAFSYMLQRRTLLGERCWDGMCAINFLQTRDDVRPGVLGCTGHSGGGTTTLFLAALEQQITAIVVSGCFCSFRASILAVPHCECNYVPGVLLWGDMGHVAGLIAPRPLCLLNGREDPIFPIHGAVEQFEVVQEVYAENGRAAACSLTTHPGAHAYHLPSARAWFDRWLTI